MRHLEFPLFIVLGTALAAVPACSHLAGARHWGKGAGQPTSSAALSATPLQTGVRALGGNGRPGAISDVVQRVLPSVVSVSPKRTVELSSSQGPFGNLPFRWFFKDQPEAPSTPRSEQGLGSGVVVGKDVILTNNHVVANATEIEITTSDDRVLKAKLVGADPATDLAVLRVDTEGHDLKPIQFGDSRRLRLGDTVLAIGNPFGVGQTVTMGIVSAEKRADLGITDYENFIQTDAAINPGNSGGALLDTSGRLVGINTAILSRSGGYQGIGFAIPTSLARPVMESLLKNGKVVRGWLGVSIQNLTPDLAEGLGIKRVEGVLIADVQPDTPAARAHLRRGDIVTKVNGNAVKTVGELRNAIATAGAGVKALLTLDRDGKEVAVTVTLDKLPDTVGSPTSGPNQPELNGESLEGLSLHALNPELKQRYNVSDDIAAGVVVMNVAPDSEAAEIGLRPGDVVLEVNRHKVTTVPEFKAAWSQRGDHTLLLVHRGGATLFLALNRSH